MKNYKVMQVYCSAGKWSSIPDRIRFEAMRLGINRSELICEILDRALTAQEAPANANPAPGA